MKDIEGVEVLIDYHTAACNCYNTHNKERPQYCRPYYRAGYHYNYGIIEAAINSCASRNESQIEILNLCVDAIRGKSWRRWVNSTTESRPQGWEQVDRDKKNGQVMEVMSEGGYNRSYYTFHKIEDINVEHLKSIRLGLGYKSIEWCNVAHAFKVLGLQHLIKEMIPEELRKEYPEDRLKYA
jgi:hypothetical protein